MRCTVKKTLQTAKAQGADVLVQVKGNQPELLACCQSLAEQRPPIAEHGEIDKGHGRIEERTAQIFAPPKDWLPEDWAPLVLRLFLCGPEPSGYPANKPRQARKRFYICTTMMPAADFAAAIRGHWRIENCLHYVRDVTFREDACHVRKNPGILARVRTMALNILRFNEVPSISDTLFNNALSFEALAALKGL
jgi:hypothetical protein